MACRCSEINRCEHEITIITWDVSPLINNACTENDTMMAYFSDIGDFLAEAVFTENLEKVNQRIVTIKKKHEGYMNNLQTKCDNGLSRVKRRLDSYCNEDSRYHEMQARRSYR